MHWYYEQSKSSPDVVGQIVKLFNGKGIEKYRLSVIQHLLQQVLVNNLKSFVISKIKFFFDEIGNSKSS